MLFRGVEEYPTSVQLERAFEAIGGNVNASTDAESTCYHSRLHPDHLRQGAALFAAMLRRPLLNDLETERRIIIEEALEDQNEKGEEISTDNLVARLLWQGHPLAVPTIGRRETIDRFSRKDLEDFHRRFYVPENTVVAVSGRIRHEEAVAAVEEAFGSWSARELPAPQPQAPKPTEGGRSLWVRDSGSQVNVQLAFRVPGRHDAMNMPLRVLRAILAWGGASRLMLRLREELGLVYGVEANLVLYGDCGSFNIEMAVAPANLVQTVSEVLQVVSRLRAAPVEAEELAAAVRGYRYELEFSRDYADAMAMRFGWGELVGYVREVAEDLRDLDAVTPAQLQAAAEEFFVVERLGAAFVGPYRDTDRPAVEESLQDFGGDLRST
ncbi:MAG: insulinase family protein [Desulfuromonadales bacterium]|nr:insulinase family protein [Desulfuromonadales bacterium]NIS43432.1 insulinase family protein [Desulfuromonadales bacterium]